MRRSEQLGSEVARRQQEPVALDQTGLDLLAQIDDRLPLSERGQIEFRYLLFVFVLKNHRK